MIVWIIEIKIHLGILIRKLFSSLQKNNKHGKYRTSLRFLQTKSR